MSLLTRFIKPSSPESLLASAGDSGISHPSDFLLRAPKRIREIAERGTFSKSLAFAGLGRSFRFRFKLEDVNDDGVCVLSTVSDLGIETSIFTVSGERVLRVAPNEKRTVDQELPAGEYSVVWKEM